jgi:hypothetical protein
MLRERFYAWLRRARLNAIGEAAQHRERHGVALSLFGMTAPGETDRVWLNLEAALDLIAAHQPVWLDRMRRLGTPVHVRRTPGTRARLVTVGEERWTILDSYFVANFLPAQIAASIVHETTHARMRFCGIAISEASLAREERACRRSELRWGRVLLAAGAEGAQAVVERAEASLAARDEEVGVVVDWNQLRVAEAVARIDAMQVPRWTKRMVARQQGVLDTPQGRAAFGE